MTLAAQTHRRVYHVVKTTSWLSDGSQGDPDGPDGPDESWFLLGSQIRLEFDSR